MSILTVAYSSGSVKTLVLPLEIAQTAVSELSRGELASLNASNDTVRLDLHPNGVEYVEVSPQNGGDAA